MPRNADGLLLPSYHWMPPYSHSWGPQVGALAAQANYAPDPEQQLILNDIFAVDDSGAPIAFEYGIAGPRQQLKTGTLIQCAIGWLFVVPDVSIISWSAHLRDTAAKSFRELAAVIDGAAVLRRRMRADRANGLHTGKDTMKALTADDRALDVLARTENGGRGLTGDRVVLDEAYALTPAMMGALLLTLTARLNAQAVSASTPAPLRGEVWRQQRDRGRAGTSTTTGWVEWGAPRKACRSKHCEHYPPDSAHHVPGCALDDEDLWAEASPLLGRRRPNGTGLTLQRMRQLRNAVPPDQWARDMLCWWDEPSEAALFGAGKWTDARRDLDGVDMPLEALGVAVAADLTAAAIVGAGTTPEGDTAVKVLAVGEGWEWVVPSLSEIRAAHDNPRVVVDLFGPSGVLRDKLTKAIRHKRALLQLTFPQWKTANALMFSGISKGGVVHAGQTELDDSVRAGAWATGSRLQLERYGRNAAPLEAAMLAVYGVAHTPTASAYSDGQGVQAV